MSDDPTPPQPHPDAAGDAHGQAALLLVESLIHGLTARQVLSVPDAVEIMTIALDVQTQAVDGAAVPSVAMVRARMLLKTLVDSLKTDLID